MRDAVGEQALAHVISDKVERAYKRGNLLEKRTRLMFDWAAYCYGPSPTGNNVVGIRSEAA